MATSKPIDFSYTGDIAVLYRGFLLMGQQPGYGPDEPPKLGYVRAYRNITYFNSDIRSHESTHFHLVYDMIEESDDEGEFTEEQFVELEGSGKIVGRMYKSVQEALGTPVYEVLEEPGEYIAEVPRKSQLEQEGRRIADQLGNGVVYKGPWIPYGPEGEFFGYFFQDEAVTMTSFVVKTYEEAKEALIDARRRFNAEPPIFT